MVVRAKRSHNSIDHRPPAISAQSCVSAAGGQAQNIYTVIFVEVLEKKKISAIARCSGVYLPAYSNSHDWKAHQRATGCLVPHGKWLIGGLLTCLHCLQFLKGKVPHHRVTLPKHKFHEEREVTAWIFADSVTYEENCSRSFTYVVQPRELSFTCGFQCSAFKHCQLTGRSGR